MTIESEKGWQVGAVLVLVGVAVVASLLTFGITQVVYQTKAIRHGCATPSQEFKWIDKEQPDE